MDRFTSYSGNGYEERKSEELRNLNTRLQYNKEQQKIKKEMQQNNKNIDHSALKVNKEQMPQYNPLPQNHLKLPGNNQFH